MLSLGSGLKSVSSAGLAAATAVACVAPALSTAAEPAVVRPSQQLAILLAAHTAVLPAGTRRVQPSQPITGEQTALPVLARTVTKEGVAWLLVMLPGRPNGTRGWIAQRGTRRATTSWRVRVETTRHRLLVYRDGQLIRDFAASVGKPSTPTPHGHFFIEESVRMPAGSAGGPFALALNAHSDVLRTFEGGSGQVAIHGAANLDGAVGTASSHGCVRLADRAIRWLAAHVAPGVPVDISD
jgi:lipoprotein-anchoring transpeptidase ErfK/SrfK